MIPKTSELRAADGNLEIIMVVVKKIFKIINPQFLSWPEHKMEDANINGSALG
jgi:hypothetical protein